MAKINNPDDSYLGNAQLKPVGVQYEFTQEQVIELTKCAEDPVYFMENYVNIVTLDHGVTKFKPYGFQKNMINTMHNNRFVLVRCARQSGKSTTTMAYVLHYILFNSNVKVSILANKEDTAKNLLDVVKLAYENLPKWMQQGVVEWNKHSIHLENGSKVRVNATSASAIRGQSANIVIIDEFAFISPNIAEEFFSSVFPTITSGKTTKLIIVSTPNGLNMFYKLWNDSEHGRNNYVTCTAKWNEVPGRDEKFKKTVMANFPSNKESKWRSEYEVEFLGSDNTLLPPSALMEMVYADPLYSNEEGLKIYEVPKQGRTYTMCVDTSRGMGEDYHAATIIDCTEIPYKVVATFKNNTVNPKLLPNILARIGRQYNDAYMLVELNDLGEAVAADMNSDEICYPNLILISSEDKSGQKADGGFGGKHIRYGLKMSGPVKIQGCAQLKDLIVDKKLIFADFDIVSELSNFVRSTKTNGSYQARKDTHDDLVMTLVAFAWLTTQTYFQDYTNISLKKNLYKERMRKLEESVSLFGFIDDGTIDFYDPSESPEADMRALAEEKSNMDRKREDFDRIRDYTKRHYNRGEEGQDRLDAFF